VRGETAAFVDRAWHLALSRPPTKEELIEAQHLIDTLERMADKDKVARYSVAESGKTPNDRAVSATESLTTLKDAPAELASLPPARAAALTKFCLALFNLNEFTYID
jgi:hypothetical protein